MVDQQLIVAALFGKREEETHEDRKGPQLEPIEARCDAADDDLQPELVVAGDVLPKEWAKRLRREGDCYHPEQLLVPRRLVCASFNPASAVEHEGQKAGGEDHFAAGRIALDEDAQKVFGLQRELVVLAAPKDHVDDLREELRRHGRVRDRRELLDEIDKVGELRFSVGCCFVLVHERGKESEEPLDIAIGELPLCRAGGDIHATAGRNGSAKRRRKLRGPPMFVGHLHWF